VRTPPRHLSAVSEYQQALATFRDIGDAWAPQVCSSPSGSSTPAPGPTDGEARDHYQQSLAAYRVPILGGSPGRSQADLE
jgi:hypothetical protein